MNKILEEIEYQLIFGKLEDKKKKKKNKNELQNDELHRLDNKQD